MGGSQVPTNLPFDQYLQRIGPFTAIGPNGRADTPKGPAQLLLLPFKGTHLVVGGVGKGVERLTDWMPVARLAGDAVAATTDGVGGLPYDLADSLIKVTAGNTAYTPVFYVNTGDDPEGLQEAKDLNIPVYTPQQIQDALEHMPRDEVPGFRLTATNSDGRAEALEQLLTAGGLAWAGVELSAGSENESTPIPPTDGDLGGGSEGGEGLE